MKSLYSFLKIFFSTLIFCNSKFQVFFIYTIRWVIVLCFTLIISILLIRFFVLMIIAIFFRCFKVLMLWIIFNIPRIILLLNGNKLTACLQIFIQLMMNIQWWNYLHSFLVSNATFQIIILWTEWIIQYFIRWILSLLIFNNRLIISIIVVVLAWVYLLRLFTFIYIGLQFILKLTLLFYEIFHFSEFFF